VLEFGGKETLEIVLDNEDAKKNGIAMRAKDVPGEGGETEADDGDRVKAAQSVAPAFAENCPEQYAACGKDQGGGTFSEGGEAKKDPEEEGGKVGCGGIGSKGEERVGRSLPGWTRRN